MSFFSKDQIFKTFSPSEWAKIDPDTRYEIRNLLIRSKTSSGAHFILHRMGVEGDCDNCSSNSRVCDQ